MAPLPDTKVRMFVVDLETTNKDGSPDWTHFGNDVVLYGFYDVDKDIHSYCLDAASARAVLTPDTDDEKIILIGHHLSFDIGWLLNKGVITQEELARRYMIWDTMVAEYILTKQQEKYCGLEKACANHGVPFKKNEHVTKHFLNGGGADTLPLDMLTEYLQADLQAAHSVFLSQYGVAEMQRQMPLILAMMDYAQATIDMRFNGVSLDKDALKNAETVCMKQQEDAALAASTSHGHIKLDTAHCPASMNKAELDPMKPPQLTKILFGGEHVYSVREPNGTYKNGNTRWKMVDKTEPYAGLIQTLGIPTDGIVSRSCDEANIEKIISKIDKLMLPPVVPVPVTPTSTLRKSRTALRAMLTQVLEYRKAAKILSTYVLPSVIDCHRYGNVLRPEIQLTATNTGRTSCSKPNLQNVPTGSVGHYRKAIVPHYRSHKLVEFDYKQLEVVALALLSKDEELKNMLVHGIDMHTHLYRKVHGVRPTDEQRRNFKRAVFALIYGGGTAAIAAQGDTTFKVAQEIAESFRSTFPATVAFNDGVMKKIEEGAKLCPERKYGIPHHVSVWESPTGRIYSFEQKLYEIPSWKRHKGRDTHETKFSKQEAANYPIQGFATADVVPLMVGLLYRFFYSEDMRRLSDDRRPLLLMTVHDSVLTEMYEYTLDEVIKKSKELLESAHVQVKERFGIDCGDLRFKVGVKVGSNWEDMKPHKEIANEN